MSDPDLVIEIRAADKAGPVLQKVANEIKGVERAAGTTAGSTDKMLARLNMVAAQGSGLGRIMSVIGVETAAAAGATTLLAGGLGFLAAGAVKAAWELGSAALKAEAVAKGGENAKTNVDKLTDAAGKLSEKLGTALAPAVNAVSRELAILANYAGDNRIQALLLRLEALQEAKAKGAYLVNPNMPLGLMTGAPLTVQGQIEQTQADIVAAMRYLPIPLASYDPLRGSRSLIYGTHGQVDYGRYEEAGLLGRVAADKEYQDRVRREAEEAARRAQALREQGLAALENYAAQRRTIERQTQNEIIQYEMDAAQRRAELARNLANVERQYAEQRRSIERDIERERFDFDQAREDRQFRLQERLGDLEREHTRNREELWADLANASTERERDAIQRELTRVDVEYRREQDTEQRRTQHEEQQAQERHGMQLGLLQQRLADERAEYDRQVAEVNARYQEQERLAAFWHAKALMDLQERLAQEAADLKAHYGTQVETMGTTTGQIVNYWGQQRQAAQAYVRDLQRIIELQGQVGNATGGVRDRLNRTGAQ